jgi:CrcB protein
MEALAAVALGGAVGALARSALQARLAPADPAALPAVTLGINLAGALVLGALMTLVLEVWPPTRLVRPLLGIGLIGAFTTMSGFALETVRMVGAGAVLGALVYVALSLGGGLLAVLLGVVTARSLGGRRRRRR